MSGLRFAGATSRSATVRGVSLYASTADFYRRYRSGIPPEVVELLNRAAPPGSPRRLLDIGTGPGFVIQALLPHFDEAVGVDVDVDLLAIARDELASASKPVELVEARAETFSLAPGWRAQLVTVCRAFHWFDRPRFLAHVINFMAPSGVLAVLGDLSIWAGGDPWKDRAREVVQEMLGHERRAGDGNYQRPSRDYGEDFAEAGFTDVRSVTIPVQRERTVESVIGLLHSMSFASAALLGERIAEFDECIRESLTPLADADGHLVDHNEFYVFTGTRP